MIQGGDPVGKRFRGQSGAAGREHYWIGDPSPGVQRKTAGASEGIAPKLSRVAVFASSGSAEYALVSKEIEIAAEPLGVKLQSLDIQSPKDFEAAFQAAAKGRANAVLFRVRDPVLNPHQTRVAALAVKSRLPAIYETAENVESRRTDEIGVNVNDLYRRAATYVDKILKAASLPISR